MINFDGLVTNLAALDWNDLKNYHLSYSPKTGYHLRRKCTTYVVGPLLDSLYCRVRRLHYGEVYETQTVRRIVKELRNIDQIDRSISDYVKALTNLWKLVYHATPTHTGVIRFLDASKDFFHNVIRDDEYIDTLSADEKSDVLDYYLRVQDYGHCERILARGLDLLNGCELLKHIEKLLKNSNSVLYRYYLLLGPEGFFYENYEANHEICHVAKILHDLVKTDPKHPKSAILFTHTLQLCLKEIHAQNSCITHNFRKGLIELLASVEAKARELKVQEQFVVDIAAARMILVMYGAEAEAMSPIKYAVEYSLTYVAAELFAAGVGDTLTQDEKGELLEHFIANKYYSYAVSLMMQDVALPKYSMHRQTSGLIDYCVEQGLLDLAATLIERWSRSPLHYAVTYDDIRLMQILVDRGHNLNVVDRYGNSLLHSAFSDSMFLWLEPQVNVRIKNAYGETPYECFEWKSFFTARSQLERAFLRQDQRGVAKILESMSPEKRTQALTDLQTAYPKTRIGDVGYTLNAAHYENKELVKVPDSEAEGYSIERLLFLFDEVAFSAKERKKHEEKLLEIGNNIKKCIPYRGTPNVGKGLREFYTVIRRALTHTLKLIYEMPESEKKKVVVQTVVHAYIEAAHMCGGRVFATACKMYTFVSTGKAPTFEGEVLELLGEYRALLFDSLIPKNDQSVHDYNAMMQKLGTRLGIPGASMYGCYEDRYIGDGIEPADILKKFMNLYTPENILYECIKQVIEQSQPLRDQFFDWCKVNLPPDFRPQEEDRAYQYLQEEVIDMQGDIMYIKAAPIAHMLAAMGIF